jgi:hypothetical protein
MIANAQRAAQTKVRSTLMLCLNKIYSVPLIAAMLGVALILVATSRYGIGLSADSVTYIAASESLVDGRGYTGARGDPLLAFPPLFSTFMAVMHIVGLPVLAAARWINAISFGGIIYLSSHWLGTRTNSLYTLVAGAVVILFSAPLIEISVYAWSEPLFVVFALLALLQLQKSASSPSLTVPLISGLYVALACLTRYAGITLIVTGVILLIVHRPGSLVLTARNILAFLAVAAGPFALWLARNYLISSTLTGDRVLSKVTFLQTLYQTLSVVSLWFLPKAIPVRPRVLLVALFLVAVSALCVYAMVRYRWREWKTIARDCSPLLLFIGIYTAFMIFTTATTALSPIDNRYMSPIFVPLIITITYALGMMVRLYAGDHLPKKAMALAATCVLLWVFYPASGTYRLVSGSLANGAGGFHTTSWMTSELVAYLKVVRLDGPTYSNEPYAVYALTGQVYKESPRKFKYESRTVTDDLQHLEQQIEAKGFVYVVWFDTSWWEEYLYSADELKTFYTLEPIVTKADGAIYRVRLREGP